MKHYQSRKTEFARCNQTRDEHSWWGENTYESRTRQQGGNMRTEEVGLTKKSTGLNTANSTAGKILRGALLASVFMGWMIHTSVQAQLINVVTATSSTNDPTPANNGGIGSPTLPPIDSGVAGGVAENNRTATTINPTISKSFNTVYIGLGGTSTLTFTITNPNAVPITAATLTDTFPTTPGAMVVATPPTIVNTTCNFAGGLPVAGAASLSLTGGTIPASSSCTFSVNVTAPVAGVYNNTTFDTTGLVTPFTGANPVTVDAPTPTAASLIVLEPIKSVILQTDTGVVGPSAGDTLRYLITYTLPAGAPAIPNFQITDILPTPNGLTFVGGSLVVTGGTANGAFNGTLANATILNPTVNFTAGNTITARFDATIDATATGAIDNQARGSGTGLPPLTGGGTGGGIPTDADAPGGSIAQPQDTATGIEPTRVTVGTAPVLGIAKEIPAPGATMTGALSFTVPYNVRFAVPAGSSAANNVQVVDNLATTFPGATITVGARTISGSPVCLPAALNAAYTGQAGETNLLLDNSPLTLTAGQACLVSFTVTVSYPDVATFAAGTTKNNTATVTAANTPGGAAIATDTSDNGTNPDPTSNNGAGGTNDPTPLSFGTITGNVYRDNDYNGTFGAGDTNLGAIDVDVSRNGASPFTVVATTDGAGAWSAIVPVSATDTYTVNVQDADLPVALRSSATVGNLSTAGSDPQATVVAPATAGSSVNTNGATNGDGYAPQSIGVAKRINTDGATRVSEGVYDIAYIVRVQNTAPVGGPNATNVQVVENFLRTFNPLVAADIALQGTPVMGGTGGCVAASVANPGAVFTGEGANALLSGNTNLTPGQFCDIAMTVRVTLGAQRGPFNNTAFASTAVLTGGATSNPGTVVPNTGAVSDPVVAGVATADSDLSDDSAALVSDTDADREANEAGENDPTTISFGTIAGRVFTDTAGNGADNGTVTDPGIANVDVIIDPAGAAPAFTIQSTAPDGTWSTIVPVSSASTPATYLVNVDDSDPRLAGLTLTTAPSDGAGNNGETVSAPATVSATVASTNDGYLGQAIGVAKNITSTTQINANTIQVTYAIIVQNTGNVTATNVQVVENFLRTFSPVSAANIALQGTPTIGGTGTCVAASVANPGAVFTGEGANALLSGNTNLTPGQNCTINLTVQITNPTATTYNNTAYASTSSTPNVGLTVPNNPVTAPTAPVGTLVQDLSDAGTNPSTNNGAGGLDDPTPLALGTITGTVFRDTNGNGTREVGENGVGNVVDVVLTPSAGAAITVQADATSGDWTAIVPLNSGLTYNVNVDDADLPADLRTSPTTGNLSNGTDPQPGVAAPTTATPNTAAGTDGYKAVADLAVDKVSSLGTYVQGAAVQYTVVVWNRGAATPISGVTFTDNVPANVTLTGWTCAPVANCSAASGADQASLNALLLNNLATNASTTPPVAGSFATITINGTATTAGTGITNTASVTLPSSVTEAIGVGTSPNSDDAVISINTPSSLTLAKSVTDSADADTLAQAGETLTYTVTITNGGGTPATGVTFNDLIPANTTFTGTATTTSGAGTVGTIGTPVTAVTGTGLTVPAFSNITVTFQVIVNTPLPANVTNISNTATVNGNSTPPAVINTVPDLVLTKTDSNVNFIVGQPGTYSFTITNQGGTTTSPTTAGAISFVDTLPTGLTRAGGVFTPSGTNGANWSCTPSVGGTIVTCASVDTVSLAPAASNTLTFQVDVAASAAPSGTNTATVNGGGEPVPNYNNNNTGTDTTTIEPRADVTTIVNVPNTPTTPGSTITGTVDFRNAGPSPAAGVTSSITFPTGLTGGSIPTVTCTPATVTAGAYNAGTGLVTLSGIPNPLPLSATPNYTCNISYVVPSNATADQIISSSITTTTNQGTNTLSDTSSVTVPLNSTDLQILKVDNPVSGTYTPGQAITYTVTVTNNGPDAVTGAIVSDTAGANLTINSVTCAEGAGGATAGCPVAAITPASFATGVTLQQLAASGADNTVIFTVNATVSAGATGSLSNTATVAVPSGFGDPTPGNNSSTDTNNPTGAPVDLTIAKTDIAPAFVVGQTGNYRLTVSNAAGSVSTSGTTTITDTLPAGLTVATGPLTLSNVVPAAAWTCTGTAPSSISCISTTPIAGGGSSSFEFPVNIGAAAAPSVTNTASVSGGGEPPVNNGNNTGTDVTPVTPVADLSVIKDNSVAAVASGSQVTYTITVANAGPNAVTGAIVSDPVVPNFNVTSVSCAETAGGATLGCPVAVTPATFASGVTLQQLAASGADSSVVFTVVGTVTGNTGNVNNVARVLAPVPGAGVPVDPTDPTRTGAGNNSDPDNDPITPQIIGVAKTANILTSGVGLPTAPTYRVRYSVVLENTGTVNATNVQISENLERTYAGVTPANINVVGGSVTSTRSGAGTASGTECVANPAFTGKDAAAATFNSTNMTLLNGSGTLEPGERCTVQFDVDVLFPLTNNAFNNTAYGSTNANPNNPGTTVPDSGATSEPTGTLTTDLSDNGVSPTGNNGSGTPEDPTPIRLVRVTGNVFQDDNADGTNAVNPADLGINNVSVVLTSSGVNPTSTTVTTDANGDWVAFVPAATYNVNVTDSTLPVGVLNGTNGNISTGTSDGLASAGESVVVAVPVNGTDPVATTPDGYGRVADLAVDKVSSLGTYVQGAAVQYTVVVWNRGAATPISGVTFTDNVPANVTLTGWTCAPVANCSAANGANQASLNALVLNNLATNASATPPVAGSFATITINGTATTAGVAINNTATIVAPTGVLEATGVGTNPNSDSASININTPSSINQTKSVDAGADNLAQAGETLTYTISVTNSGGTATSVNITDSIPTNTTYVTGSASNGGTFAAGTVTWTGINIPANNVATPVTVTFQVTVNTPIPANTTQISNVAAVDDPSDPNPPNSTPPVITPTVPDLVIAKTATPQPFIVGQLGAFQFTTTNQGGTTTGANTITVTDILPTGITIPDGAITEGGAQAGNWTCTASNTLGVTTVTCTSTTAIVVGGSSVFTIPVNVGATADTGLLPDQTNTATVQGGGEPVPSYNNNNTGSTPVNTDPRADLQITKTNGASSVAANGTTTYTVTVTNNGPSPVPAGAVVNDPIAAGLTKTSVTCVGTACPTAPISVSSFEAGVTLGALANGATAVFTVNANVTAIAGNVNNIANIVSSPVVDTDATNNTANDQDPITAQQIGVAKAITSTTQVNPNTLDVTYSIIVQNTGTVTATNVQVVENFLRTFSPLTAADIALQGTPSIVAGGGALAADCAPATTTFTGEGANALLAGNTNLAVGANCTISLTVRVSNLTATTYNNTAYGSTSSNPNVGVTVPNDPTIVPANPVGTITTDESDAGTNPTGNNGGGGTNDPTPLALGSITGTVFGDTNGNGIQDGTEAGVGTPIPVVITPSAGTPITAQTDPTTGVWTAIVPLNSGLTYGVNVTDSSLPAELRTDVNTGNLTTPLSDPETGILAPTTATPNRSSTNDGYARVADVRVLKTVSPSVVTVGNPVTYTITVWNGGPANANNIAITDTIPASVTLTGWTCTASGTANCDAANGADQASLNALTVDVPVNASVAAPTTGSFVTITINGTANTAGSPSNLARVTVPPVGSPDFVHDPVTNGTGPNPSRENESSVPVTINTPSSINQTKSVDAGADNLAQAGETLTYTISVTNSGGTATSVNITDSIPANTTYVTGSASNGGTFAAGTVTWTAVNIPANNVATPVTVTFQVTVNTPLPANTTQISNVAAVDDPLTPAPPNPTPPVITPTVPDLVIAKTDNAATFVVGLPGTYELTVTNQGGTTTGANTITVTDTLPSGLTRADGVFTPNGANGANWSCTAAANVITCTSTTPILPAGSSVLSFQVIPTNTALPSVSNTVSVQGGGEPVSNYNSNNTATEPTPVVAQQIGVVKAAPAVVNPVAGNPLAFDIPYAIQVSNLSAVTTATNVQIVDDLTAANAYPAPAVVTIISPAVVSSGGCTINPTAYNGTTQTALLAGSDTLAANTSCIVKFTARVTYPNVGAIPTTDRENRAVASTSATPNPNGTNPPIVTDTSTPTVPNGGGDPTTPPTTGDTPNPTPTRLNQPPVTQDRTNDPIVLTANATVLNVNPPAGSPNLLGTDPDGTVTGYRITSLPTNGTLALGGTPVAIGDIIPAASLGTLTFDPDGTAPVSGSTSFNYAAIDNNNLEDGTPNTYSIPLENVPPTTDDHTNVPVNTGGVNAPLALNPVAPALSGADTDGTVASFVVTTLPSSGTLLYNGNPIVAGTTVIPNTPADLALVTYTPSTIQPAGNSVTFQYAARDNNGLQDGSPATFTIPYTVQTIDAVKSAGAPTVISPTSYSVPFNIKVGNSSTVPATKVQVIENLTRTFAGATSIVVSSFNIAPVGGATCTAPTVAFDGTGNNALLAGSDTLTQGQSCTITFTVTVGFASVADAITVRQNQVFASTTAQPGNNPGHTVPNDPAQPVVPPVNGLATDSSTNSPTLPGTPNTDTPSPTPITPITIGSISGLVFEDRNSNGTRDPGEPGIGNVPVTVTPSVGAPVVVNTNPDGTYSVANLPLGSTQVSVTDPANSRLTTANDPQSVVVVPGNSPVEDVGFVFLGNVRGNVFVDSNGNGSQAGATETGFAAQVRLTNGNFTVIVPADLVTGVYTADNVPVGTVTVEVLNSSIPTTLQTAGVPNQTAGVNPSAVTVTTANTPANRADAGADGYQPNPPVAVNDSISTTADTNVDIPVLTNDSSTIPNTKDPTSVIFTPTGQPAGSTVTNGGKTLTVPNEGTYTINPTTGVVTFDPLPTFTGSTTPVQYTFADNGGLVSNPALITVSVGAPTKGTVTGLVWRDDNGDGIKQATEPGIGNVDVVVTPTTGAPVTVSTNPDGTWSAPGVDAGNATVKVQTTDTDFPTGATLTTTGSDPSNVVVVAGGTVADAQDGFRLPAPATLPNTANTPNNTPVNNLDILANDTASSPLTLIASSVVFQGGGAITNGGKTLTNPQGVYNINPDGTVNFVPDSPAIVGVLTPVQYTVADSSGNVSSPTNITITVGAIGTGSIQGTVFFDDNGNGTRDGSEDGIPNVQVTATPVGGGAPIPLVTNVSGAYTALNVPAGNYVIQVVSTSLPANVKTGTVPNQTAGTNDPANPLNTTTVVGGAVAQADPDGYRLNPPVASNDSSTTPVNVPVSFSLTGNDNATNPANIVPSTVDLNPSVAGQQTTRDVTEGRFTVNGIGEVTFTPNLNYSGNVTPITYTVLDSTTQQSNAATVNVVVTPTAANDSATTPVNTPVIVPILANDVGSLIPSTVVFPTQPNGTVSNGGKKLTISNEGVYDVNPDGTVTFTPVNGFIGTVKPVTYSVSDGVTTRTALIDNLIVAAQTGSLRGVVFQDLDGNGSQGATEPGIPNIDVVITNGSFTRTVVTDANGVYTADTVPTGTVTVDVVTTDPQFPTNVTQTAGIDPSVVTVAAINTPATPANAGADGYRPVAPVAVNDSVTTPADTNVDIPVLTNDSSTAPSTKDPSSVIFTPTGQPVGSTVSPDGKTLTVLNEGTYTINPTTGVVTFDPLPTFTGSTTPVQYTFEDSNGQPSNPAQIAVDVGAPNKGDVTGKVFEDTNGNGTQEAGELGIPNVQVTITPVTGAPITVLTNATGDYTALNVPVGNASVDVVESSIPAKYKNATGTPNQTAGTDPTNNVAVTAGGTTNAGIDGYRPNPPVANNDSRVAPDTSTPVNNIPVLNNDTSSSPLVPSSVTFPSAGQPTGNAVSPDGKQITVLNKGTFTINPDGTISFVPAPTFDGTMPEPVKYTVQDTTGQTSNPANLVVTAPGNPALANIVGKVYRDDNGNNTQDGSEPGLENISVRVTNTAGFDVTVQTAADGTYSVANLPLGIPATVTVVESSIPSGLKTGTTPNQTEGTNPTQIASPMAGTNNAGNDGYRLNPPVARPDAATTPLNTPITFSLTGNDTATNPANVAPDTIDLDPSTPARETTRTTPTGTYTVNGVGEVIFTPTAGFSGKATQITYTVLDSTGQKSNVTTVDVVVLPTAANDSQSTPANTPITFNPLTNDGGSLVPSSVVFPVTSQPVGSSVSNGGKKLTIPGEGVYDVNPDGTITFTPENGFTGAVKPVRYSVNDGVTTREAVIDMTVTAQTGSLRGVVFYDLDGNGSQGATEPGIPNIDVVLTNGSFTTTVTTNADGIYTRDNVPTGTVTVNVINTDPDFPANVTQTAGVDPSVVTVAVTNTPASPANAGADGYRPAAPVATNDSATVPLGATSVNIPVLDNDTSTAPSTKDPSSVIFTPTGQPTGSTVSPDGKTLTVPNEGTYTINPTTGVVTFTPVPAFTGSTTPVQYTFEDSNGQPSNPAQIAVTVGTPNKGSITGKVFEDTNGNGTQDVGEPNLENVQVTITPASGAAVTVVTNASGVYTALNLPTGNAVVNVVDSSIPSIYKNATGTPNQTAGTDPTNNVAVTAGNTTNAGIDGYRPNPPIGNPDNRVAPDTSTPINNIPVLNNDTSSNPLVPSSVVFPITGQPTGSTVTPDGKQITVPNVGTYTVNPDGTIDFVPAPTFTGNPVSVKYTVQDTTGQTSQPTDLTISAPGNPALATVIGKVYRDDNGNNTQDGSEPGLENISVTVTNGTFTATVQTAPNGTYSVPNVPITSPITVTVDNATIPATLKTGTTPNQTEGTNPTQIASPVAGTNNAGNDGYRLNPPVARPDSATTPLNTPITFSLTGNDTATNPANVAPDTIDLDPSTPARETTRTVPEGVFTVNGIGEVTFVPSNNFSGVVTPITYTVLDSTTQKSNVATVNVTVLPRSSNDMATTSQETPVTVNVLNNDAGSLIPSSVIFPATGQPVGSSVSNGGKKLTVPSEGVYDINPDGTITFTPATGFFGTAKPVTYQVTDGTTPVTATLTVNVSEVQTARVEVPVFNDTDGDGVRDPNETPIVGATVTLYEVVPDPANPGKFIVKKDPTTGLPIRLIDPSTNQPYPPVVTGPDGIAVFPNVKVGQVGIVVTDPSGKVLTTGNNIQVINVLPNRVNTTPAVGYIPPVINLTITPDRQVVTPGDNLPYTSVIINNTPGSLTPLKYPQYTVTLPTGVKFDPTKPVTVTIGNQTVTIDPTGTTLRPNPTTGVLEPVSNIRVDPVTNQLIIQLPTDLKNGEPVTVKFDTIVAPNVDPAKQLIAIGTVTGIAQNPSLTGVPVSVNASSGAIAAAAVKINLGVFDNKSVILGRVYFDANNNNNYDPATTVLYGKTQTSDYPLAGARVYFSDGRSAVTDQNGLYNLPNVAPGTYAIRLDPVTAPYTVKRVPEDQGSAGTRHVRVGEVGGIIYADFALVPPSGAAVKARSTTVQRGPVTLQKSMVQGGAGYAVTIKVNVAKAVNNLVITDPLPSNTTRGPITINGTTVTPVISGNSITIPGTVAAGTYTIVYALFSPLPPDLALTDPDISYEEIFVLIPLKLEPEATTPVLETPSPFTPTADNAVEVDSEISRKFGDEVIQ
jgi:uncharacterized repeat protein (TIGR01451 family)